MKKIVTVFLILASFNLYSQFDCDIILNSQNEVDSMAINYSGCSTIYALIIDGIDITSLEGISIGNCRSLTIKNTSLQDLSGLENLREVYKPSNIFPGGPDPGIYIENNPLLHDLGALKNVEKTSNLHIISNPSLTTLGLNIKDFAFYETPSITLGGGKNIRIENNESLKNLNGLDSLRQSGDFFLINNPVLDDISAINNLDLVYRRVSLGNGTGSLIIKDNPELHSLSALEGIIVHDEFIIDNNSSLIDLNGLKKIRTHSLIVENNRNLTTLGNLDIHLEASFFIYHGSDIQINNNFSLEDIGINSLTPSGVLPGLEITNNPKLNICHNSYVCDIIERDKMNTNVEIVSIENNGIGCYSSAKVESNCDGNILQGTVFIDNNCNQSQDSLEMGIPNLFLYDLGISDKFVGISSDRGNYDFIRPVLLDSSFSFSPESLVGYSYFPESYSTTSGDYNLDFGACIDSLVSNLSIDLTALNPPRPSFKNAYKLCITNYGSTIEHGNVNLDLVNSSEIEPFLSYIEIDNGTESNLDLSWSFSSLDLFQTECWTISSEYSPTTPLGTKITYQAAVTSTTGLSDIDEENNISELCQTVIGSFDPNDKNVTPDSIEYDDRLNANTFEYLIRFQNEGTAPAEFVIVYDTIQSIMDMQSFRMISASHDYNLIFIRENIIRWKFLNINLPPVSVDSTGSIGFVKFNITNIPDVEFTEPIRNRASIYFDFNDPIVTEYAIVSFSNAPLDLSVELERSHLDCSQIKFDLEIQNKDIVISENTTFKFFLNETSGLDSYLFSEIDGASLEGDTLVWEINSIQPSETIAYSILIETENSFYEEATNLVATTIIDNSIGSDSKELILGSFQPSSFDITSQTTMDNCYCLTEITESLKIRDDSSVDRITNLDSLINLEKVGTLDVGICPLLEEIVGFSNLIEIGRLQIYNNALLQSISGFENLQFLEHFNLAFNPMLGDIGNFNPLSTSPLTSLTLRNNNTLNTCNSSFICSIIEDGSADIIIMDNAQDCNSVEAVEVSCGLSAVNENQALSDIIIYPNPTKDKLFIDYPSNKSIKAQIKLNSIDGTLIHSSSDIDPHNWSLDVTKIPSGIYFITVQSEEGRVTKKVVIEK